MSDVADLGYRPHRFQLEIHNRATRFCVVVAHRRFGKTVCSIATLMHGALSDTTESGRYGYLAPFLKQAKSVAWDYVRAFAARVPGIKVNETDLSVDLPNGSRIRLYGGDNPDAIRGQYFSGIVIDEMADLRPDLWGAIIRPALADRRGWALFIGTPKGINQFSELYNSAASGTDPEWSAMLYPVSETGLIDEAELASARASMSEAQARSEWECDFSAAADDVLITIDLVTRSIAKVVQEHELHGLARVLGVDVARYGADRSVIQRRWGLYALEPMVFQGLSNMDLAAKVAQVITDWGPDATFVDGGRGEGVIDRLRQLGFPVTEVNFGGRPLDQRFADKRSEMWQGIKSWLEAGGVLPNSMPLKADLCAPRYSFDSVNRLKLESKDALKERGMRSPDVADALALTFALPVPAPGLFRPRPAIGRERRQYDPHAG